MWGKKILWRRRKDVGPIFDQCLMNSWIATLGYKENFRNYRFVTIRTMEAVCNFNAKNYICCTSGLECCKRLVCIWFFSLFGLQYYRFHFILCELFVNCTSWGIKLVVMQYYSVNNHSIDFLFLKLYWQHNWFEVLNHSWVSMIHIQ